MVVQGTLHGKPGDMKTAFLLLIVVTGASLSKRPAMMNQTAAAAFHLEMPRELPPQNASAKPSLEFPINP